MLGLMLQDDLKIIWRTAAEKLCSDLIYTNIYLKTVSSSERNELLFDAFISTL